MRFGLLGLTLAMGPAGCYFGPSLNSAGQGGEEGGPEAENALACGDDTLVGASALRRLTAAQYANTVRDLLGVESPVVDTFLPDDRTGPFSTNALVAASELSIEKYREAAEDISVRATERVTEVAPCDGGDEEACAEDFIAHFGVRAFRRPLEETEFATLRDAYELGAANGGYEGGIRLVIATALQSPNFLYMFEFGEGEAVDGLVSLSSWELATRLSYMLWNTMPDEELLAAADDGSLASPEALEEQARRLLDDERSADALVTFHAQWLGVEELDGTDKDPEYFPEWSEELASGMKDEFSRFVTYVFENDGTLASLLTAPYAFPEGDLLSLYGVSRSQLDEDGMVELPDTQRSGLLTLPAVLSRHAHRERTSPVHRGLLVREELFCQPMPAPPPGVTDTLPEPQPGVSEQDLLRQHRENPECSTCHDLIDPVGFAFEKYDGIGRFRETEHDKPIDASGELLATDVDGPIDGIPDMATRLVESEQVQACVAEQWFRFTFGRPTVAEDTCSKSMAVNALLESDGDVREMLVALVTADAFRYRKTDPA